jgi:hypothetical protein
MTQSEYNKLKEQCTGNPFKEIKLTILLKLSNENMEANHISAYTELLKYIDTQIQLTENA